jgi:hypothetical protein
VRLVGLEELGRCIGCYWCGCFQGKRSVDSLQEVLVLSVLTSVCDGSGVASYDSNICEETRVHRPFILPHHQYHPVPGPKLVKCDGWLAVGRRVVSRALRSLSAVLYSTTTWLWARLRRRVVVDLGTQRFVSRRRGVRTAVRVIARGAECFELRTHACVYRLPAWGLLW